MKKLLIFTTMLVIISLVFSSCQFPGVKNLDKDLEGMDEPAEQAEKQVEPTTKPIRVLEATPSVSVTLAPTKAVLKTDKDYITQAMADKKGKSFADVTLKVNNQEGDNASGAVTFAGEMGGGWFIASKKSGSWVVVADGNGTIMCSDLVGYDFSTDMVPECWNEATGALVVR